MVRYWYTLYILNAAIRFWIWVLLIGTWLIAKKDSFIYNCYVHNWLFVNRHNIASTEPTKVVKVLSSQKIKRLTWWGQNIIPMKTHRVDILRKFDSSNYFKFWYLHYISFAIINDKLSKLDNVKNYHQYYSFCQK